MRTLLVWLACYLGAAVMSLAVWQGVQTGYPMDSFWTLSVIGRVGVITITIAGLLLLAAVNAWKTRHILLRSQYRWRVPVWLFDTGLGLLLFGVLFSVSPQFYYSFYQQIIADLPNQWVIDSAFNWDRLREVAVPRTGGSIADHAAAVAMGGIVLFTAYLHKR